MCICIFTYSIYNGASPEIVYGMMVPSTLVPKLSSELRCPQCQNILDSNAGIAIDLREKV